MRAVETPQPLFVDVEVNALHGIQQNLQTLLQRILQLSILALECGGMAWFPPAQSTFHASRCSTDDTADAIRSSKATWVADA